MISQHIRGHVEIHRVAGRPPEEEVDSDPVGFGAALVAGVGAVERLRDPAGGQREPLADRAAVGDDGVEELGLARQPIEIEHPAVSGEPAVAVVLLERPIQQREAGDEAAFLGVLGVAGNLSQRGQAVDQRGIAGGETGGVSSADAFEVLTLAVVGAGADRVIADPASGLQEPGVGLDLLPLAQSQQQPPVAP